MTPNAAAPPTARVAFVAVALPWGRLVVSDYRHATLAGAAFEAALAHERTGHPTGVLCGLYLVRTFG